MWQLRNPFCQLLPRRVTWGGDVMCTCELTDIEICMCVFNSRIHPRAGERVRGGGACHPIWVSAWPYQVSVKHVLNTTPFPLITRVITWMLGDAQKSDWPHPPPPPLNVTPPNGRRWVMRQSICSISIEIVHTFWLLTPRLEGADNGDAGWGLQLGRLNWYYKYYYVMIWYHVREYNNHIMSA